mmetsp:Transcript_118059/g.252201  ORF Transcript_118059/g.252201 Transcript_118059/m.252201 type:complete len:227 (+) Transcript_118059:129-809(+)
MSWMMDRFLCCCVNTVGNADHVGALSGELLGHSGGHEVSYPLDSASPQFPMDTSSKLVKSPRSECGEFNGGATARSNASASSSMPAEEKEKEKARLQRLVKDFAKEAVTGIAVSLVNPETTRSSPYFFQMDRYLTVFSLKPKDGSTAESSVQDFNVKDLTSIYKGSELSVKAPSLGEGKLAGHCVGLDTNRADRRLFFHFDESLDRDKFYTCLKILRMSVDINKPP